jgi:hypothetical protein
MFFYFLSNDIFFFLLYSWFVFLWNCQKEAFRGNPDSGRDGSTGSLFSSIACVMSCGENLWFVFVGSKYKKRSHPQIAPIKNPHKLKPDRMQFKLTSVLLLLVAAASAADSTTSDSASANATSTVTATASVNASSTASAPASTITASANGTEGNNNSTNSSINYSTKAGGAPGNHYVSSSLAAVLGLGAVLVASL